MDDFALASDDFVLDDNALREIGCAETEYATTQQPPRSPIVIEDSQIIQRRGDASAGVDAGPASFELRQTREENWRLRGEVDILRQNLKSARADAERVRTQLLTTTQHTGQQLREQQMHFEAVVKRLETELAFLRQENMAWIAPRERPADELRVQVEVATVDKPVEDTIMVSPKDAGAIDELSDELVQRLSKRRREFRIKRHLKHALK